ncbi:hypothetical protein ACJ73_08876 [Blastomyces percursus]|uniref:Uncharacterized protein n=1 Tax=Blastomyces percursus TaxID=1658174 RepID=A0A1J9QKY7_9EURO|nr:hypothetical protein ACJ73_08876 [Blastomyces percursus]
MADVALSQGLAAGTTATNTQQHQQPSKTPNDYGTPNLLFLFYIPQVPESEKDNINSQKADIQSWFAYELGKTELQVLDQLEDGNLPTDDSAASRVKRTTYRAKVVKVYRENGQTWAPRSQTGNATKKMTVKKQDLNGAIREELLTHYITRGAVPAEFSFILQTVNLLIASNPSWEHKYLISHVDFKYNPSTKEIKPDITVSSFEVKVPDQNDDHADENIVIEYSDYKLGFVRDTWNDAKGAAMDFITAGEGIRKQMSLEFYVGGSNSST